MTRSILILAALALAYLLWAGYQSSTPEGKARSADEADIESCRARVAADEDMRVMEMHRKECAKLQAAFDEKWR